MADALNGEIQSMQLIITAPDGQYNGELFDFGDNHHLVYFPDWEGCKTDYAVRKAEQLAMALSGKVLLTDIYGLNNQPKNYGIHADPFIRQTLSNPLALREKMAALAPVYAECLGTTQEQLSYAGVCFGGSIAFETGRSEARAKKVISIHGTPSSSSPLQQANSTQFLLIQGTNDPHIPMQEVNRFADEMATVGNDWQVSLLGNAQHSFTKEEIGTGGYGSRFDSKANQRAFRYTQAFIEA